MTMGEKDDIIIETDDDKLEIDIVDDTPPEDRNRPRRPDGAEPDIPTDEEIEQYSANVQKRIKQLKYEFHEERRAKEAFLREREEATAAAQRAIEAEKRARADAEKYRKMVEDGEPVLIEQASGRLDAQIEQAKRAYQDAYETGDAAKLAEVSSTLAQLQAEKVRVNNFADEVKRRKAQTQPQERQEPVQPQRPQAPKPSARSMEWAEKNKTWFQVDPEMTGYAFGVHERVIKSGIQPDTDEYYRQIDKSMRQKFPEQFGAQQETPAARPGTVVAPADRTAKSPRKVRLTETQVRLARKLGLTNEQYARALLEQAEREARS